MKAFFKPLMSWFAGLVNLGLFFDDGGIDSLINQLYFLQLDLQANKIVRIYYQLVILETAKCTLMLLSLLFLYLANQDRIHTFFEWVGGKVIAGFGWCKKQLQGLLKRFH